MSKKDKIQRLEEIVGELQGKTYAHERAIFSLNVKADWQKADKQEITVGEMHVYIEYLQNRLEVWNIAFAGLEQWCEKDKYPQGAKADWQEAEEFIKGRLYRNDRGELVLCTKTSESHQHFDGVLVDAPTTSDYEIGSIFIWYKEGFKPFKNNWFFNYPEDPAK